MEHNKINVRVKTLELVQISLMTALIYVATAFINVPSPYRGVVHLGDSMVFVAAIVLGKKKGAAASALGMCLFDLLSPYSYWAPYTFIIKGVMAYIAGAVASRGKNYIFAFTLGGLWMVFGYFLSSIFISRFYFTMTLSNSLIMSLADIKSNIVQFAFGILIAVPLLKALNKTNIIKKRG